MLMYACTSLLISLDIYLSLCMLNLSNFFFLLQNRDFPEDIISPSDLRYIKLFPSEVLQDEDCEPRFNFLQRSQLLTFYSLILCTTIKDMQVFKCGEIPPFIFILCSSLAMFLIIFFQFETL